MAKRQSSRRLPTSAKSRPLPSKNRPPPIANRPPPTENANLLLAALPAADYARLLPELSVVPLTLKTLLHKPGEALRHVYFPSGGFCSMLTVLEDGTMRSVITAHACGRSSC